MRTMREHLRIVFGRIQPEALINTLLNGNSCGMKADSHNIDRLAYRHFSMDMLKELTYEEVDALHDHMAERIQIRGKDCGRSVFALLPDYTLNVLRMDGTEPVCRQDQILNWRSCYLYLGQDLLTTAYLAYVDIAHRRVTRDFIWPSQIRSDDARLASILEKGLAENHFHLNGSTRMFDLSWICLMNYPLKIKTYFSSGNRSESSINEKFEEALNGTASYGTADNRMSWEKRIALAGWIRSVLFSWIYGEKPDGDLLGGVFRLADSEMFEIYGKLSEKIDLLRLLSGGLRFKQLNNRDYNIDYAINSEALSAENADHCCRSLTGERALLYKAFYMTYSGSLNDEKENKLFTDLLYLYILIKTQFRSELIQVNERYGFKNFAKYQDRKDLIFNKFPQYSLEAKHLSANESMTNGSVCSLEMRIAPSDTRSGICSKVRKNDREIRFLRQEEEPCGNRGLKESGLESNYFYVIHFPKIPERQDELPTASSERNHFEDIFRVKPRNHSLREKTRKQAFAIAGAMQKWDWLCTRIRGIDACTYEIGCRPEVFATEFRFLRELVLSADSENIFPERRLQPKIMATYHVGEDFMDIIDGLRAVDETIQFLEMEPGERLGHALALGTDPEEYYKLKHRRIIISKQDMLDNIVWALYRTRELGISLDYTLHEKLRQTAEQLIFEIYGRYEAQSRNYSLHEYYDSWQLRGDSPELYRSDRFDVKNYETGKGYYSSSTVYQYNLHRIRRAHDMESFSSIRQNNAVVHLYHMYHFDPGARSSGQKEYEYKADESYIRMAYDIQEKMMQDISRKRIGIECNPSSNVLIGPFRTYARHPLFRFYPPQAGCGQTLQYVSVNTDDQGVFDTSLKMEFALLASAMHSMKNDTDGNFRYSDDLIYAYLETLRQNGISQTFPRTTACNPGKECKQIEWPPVWQTTSPDLPDYLKSTECRS